MATSASTETRIKVVRSYDGELHALISFPRSVACLPIPEAFRAVEEGLVDAQDRLEAELLRAG